MPQDNLYNIQAIEITEDSVSTTIVLNTSHPVFAGHFPGRPILPGACMLDMVREIVSAALNTRLRLIKAGNIKFIALVDPLQNSTLQFRAKYIQQSNELKITATLSAESICMKMDGVYLISTSR